MPDVICATGACVKVKVTDSLDVMLGEICFSQEAQGDIVVTAVRTIIERSVCFTWVSLLCRPISDNWTNIINKSGWILCSRLLKSEY